MRMRSLQERLTELTTEFQALVPKKHSACSNSRWLNVLVRNAYEPPANLHSLLGQGPLFEPRQGCCLATVLVTHVCTLRRLGWQAPTHRLQVRLMPTDSFETKRTDVESPVPQSQVDPGKTCSTSAKENWQTLFLSPHLWHFRCQLRGMPPTRSGASGTSHNRSSSMAWPETKAPFSAQKRLSLADRATPGRNEPCTELRAPVKLRCCNLNPITWQRTSCGATMPRSAQH